MARMLRQDSLSNLFVVTSRAKHAFERFDELMERGKESSFCRAMLMLGPARSGKTHILKEWVRLRKHADPAFKALISEVPSGCTLKQMLEQLLEDLGDPDPSYGSPGARKLRVKQLVSSYDIVIIDELQRLIDEGTGKVKKDVASWLANFLNYNACPLLLAGERYAELVLEGRDDNQYLEGRLLGEVSIEPYDWHDARDQKEFRAFLSKLDQDLGMPERATLHDVDTALRIHSFSNGRVGQVARLLDEARAVARKEGRPKLTHDLLARAVDLLRVGKGRKSSNPFRVAQPLPGGKGPMNVRDGQDADDGQAEAA